MSALRTISAMEEERMTIEFYNEFLAQNRDLYDMDIHEFFRQQRAYVDRKFVERRQRLRSG